MNVPPRFRLAVKSHLARLQSRETHYAGLSAPRILCIEGPPGVGKSRQLTSCLDELGSPYIRVDVSDFGGHFEGDPAKDLDAAMNDAKDLYNGACRPSLVIDDFDMGLGRSDDTNYTVNTQLTTGWLMGQADAVYRSGFSEAEPAVFVTGNDFSSVHRPLMRSGRARLVKYIPTADELVSVLSPIFEAHADCTPDELVHSFPSAVLVDFLEAMSELRDRWVTARISEGTDLLSTEVAPKLTATDICSVLAANLGVSTPV